MARYDTLRLKHINLLEKPPSLSLFPNKTTAYISGALGMVVGVAASSVINMTGAGKLSPAPSAAGSRARRG